MTKQDAYYLQQVPQSLYRNTKEQDSGEREPLNIKLAPIQAKADEKTMLKQRIDDKISYLIQALIPEEKVDRVNKTKLLEDIYTKLAL